MMMQLSIGLDYGPAWLLPAVDIFGKAAAHSFVLAENIASGEILVTPDFNDKLRQERDPTLLKPVYGLPARFLKKSSVSCQGCMNA